MFKRRRKRLQQTRKSARKKGVLRFLVRNLKAFKQSRLSQAGFVLPTVTMVMLVVVLLTIAISLRSFDRADQARNVRVNQQLINAATPALDRAQAKLYELLAGGDRTAGTPDDDSIEKTLTSEVEIDTDGDGKPDEEVDKYTFGDEERVKVSYNGEEMNTAWKFPVDTDNDGKPDGDTIYGIFFKTPPADEDERARSPLEARTPPMVFEETAGSSNPKCVALNSSTGLGGGTGWESRSGNLKKSFFVYIANVPSNGSGAVSALEYQQDWTRIPPSTNAIRYEGDLEVAPGPAFRLNGRIQSLGNMIISPSGSNNIDLYLVSDPESCFYNDQNNQITVGGHIVNGLIGKDSDLDTASKVKIHLMKGNNAPDQTITLEGNESTTASSKQVYYDRAIYEERIKELAALVPIGNEPSTVQAKIEDGGNRDNALQTYFSGLVRNVPMAEKECTADCTGIDGSGDTLRPADSKKDTLVMPVEGQTNIPITYLPATDPKIRENSPNTHFNIGDRLLVGNNLPSQWWDENEQEFVTEEELTDQFWVDKDGKATENLRLRQTQVKSVPEVGATARDGLWEREAAREVLLPLSGRGGLRVITGAGIYDRDKSFLPPPIPETMYDGKFTVVWPDTMPMSPVRDSKVYDNVNERWLENYDPSSANFPHKGDLQMRASVVYHYAHDFGKNPTDTGDPLEAQKPKYCVSSYYDPSTEDTAKNLSTLPFNANNAGRSNNGIVYDFPASGEATYAAQLQQQAMLVFPDGRFVNELLYKAYFNELGGNKAATQRTLSEQAAVDAAVCSLQILADATPVAAPELPHGAIKEIAFLDTREIKGLDRDDPTTDVDETFTLKDSTLTNSQNNLPLEERQPLEIRATQLDLNLLRNAKITVGVAEFQGPQPEYFLPNTGIVYASRDDALPDISDVLTNSDITINDPYDDDDIGKSDNDMLLDPTRRPNGIMLINGDRLARNDANNDGQNDTKPTSLDDISKEKGLVLFSNNPVYIQGDFNIHQHEEFNDELTDTWSNFYTRGANGLDDNFACRPGDPRLPECEEGDSWRSAKVVADAITVMSDNWRAGFRNQGDFDHRSNNREGATVFLDTVDYVDNNDVKVPRERYRRLFNGFFANSFATNGLSSEWKFLTGSELKDSAYSGNNNTAINSSYFTNFQVPVQRRSGNNANVFPEYLMETCRKLPVSECTAEDWVVGYDVDGDNNYNEPVTFDVNENGTPGDADDLEGNIKAHQMRDLINNVLNSTPAPDYEITQLLSGTTSFLGRDTTSTDWGNLQKINQRFPRRVAFKRNIYGQLVLESDGQTGTDNDMVPIPMGMRNVSVVPNSALNGTTAAQKRQPDEYPYNNRLQSRTTNYAINQRENALWFRTTNTGNTGTIIEPSDNITYQNNRPLFYWNPPNAATGSAYSSFRTTEVNPDNWLLPPTKAVDGVELGAANDYAVCIPSNSTKKKDIYKGIVGTDSCDATTAIATFNTKLDSLTVENTKPTWTVGTSNLYLDAIKSTSTTDDDILDDNVTGGDGILVYEITNATIGDATNVVTITIAGNPDDIFVLKVPNNVTFGIAGNPGVRMLLKGGVNPNNIFWVFGGNVTFANAPAPVPTPPLDQSHQLTGNFIGSGTITIGNNTNLLGVRLLGFSGLTGTPSTITAMTSQAQPLLVPVLQIHQPTGNPTDNLAAIPTGNADAAANNTRWVPRATNTEFNLIFSGGDVPSDPENSLTNGGVQNLVRFIENWQVPTQQKTEIQGAFMLSGRSKFATAPLQQAGGVATDLSTLFGYPQRYYIGTGDRKHGIFAPPDRQWGFDVGLLSQPMDQFDLQLSEPVDEPDEYFREVSRDDAWVKGLLCAVEDNGNNTPVVSDLYNSDFCEDYK